MRKIEFSYRTVPIALLLLCIISYGILAPWLGFLQDDWRYIWQVHAFGPLRLIESFSGERPYLAGVYILTSSLLGTSALNWQLFAVFSHWLATLALWWLLRLAWPQHIRRITWIAFLFAIYPGFRQSNLAVMYGNLFLIYAIHLFSLGAMLLSLRLRKWFWPLTILAVFSSAFSLFSVEYFFGLELLRPIFIWISLRNRGEDTPNKTRILSIGLHWLPYFCITVAFFVWRIFIFKFPTKYKPVLFNDLISNPFSTIFHFVTTVIQDTLKVNLFSWSQTTSILQNNQELSGRIALGLAILTGLFVYFYLSKLKTVEDKEEMDTQPPQKWLWEAIGIGLFSTLVSGWPFWFVNAQISTDIGGDRFTSAFMVGACIFIIALIELFVRPRLQQIIIISILIGLAVGQHFLDANDLRKAHLAQGTFFRQLAQRAPGLKPGTILLTDKLHFLFTSDSSLTAPLNWIFDQTPPYSIQYAIFELDSRLGHVIPELKPGIPITYSYWSTRLTSSTSQVLIFNYAPPGCLQVIDPSVNLLSVMPELVADAAHLSNLNQIDVDATPPLSMIESLFGKGQTLGWCDYFEQADLARQNQDWNKIKQIGDQVFRLDFSTENPIEYIPFIEGYAHSNQFNTAQRLTREAFRSMPAIQPELCSTWEKIKTAMNLTKEQQALINDLMDQIYCD